PKVISSRLPRAIGDSGKIVLVAIAPGAQASAGVVRPRKHAHRILISSPSPSDRTSDVDPAPALSEIESKPCGSDCLAIWICIGVDRPIRGRRRPNAGPVGVDGHPGVAEGFKGRPCRVVRVFVPGGFIARLQHQLISWELGKSFRYEIAVCYVQVRLSVVQR